MTVCLGLFDDLYDVCVRLCRGAFDAGTDVASAGIRFLSTRGQFGGPSGGLLLARDDA